MLNGKLPSGALDAPEMTNYDCYPGARMRGRDAGGLGAEQEQNKGGKLVNRKNCPL
jgi:hypothetical protein